MVTVLSSLCHLLSKGTINWTLPEGRTRVSASWWPPGQPLAFVSSPLRIWGTDWWRYPSYWREDNILGGCQELLWVSRAPFASILGLVYRKGVCLKGRSPPNREAGYTTGDSTREAGWKHVLSQTHWCPSQCGWNSRECQPQGWHWVAALVPGKEAPKVAAGLFPSCHPHCHCDCSPGLSTPSKQSESCLTKNRLQKYI